MIQYLSELLQQPLEAKFDCAIGYHTPEAIIAAILEGCPESTAVIPDRHQAITYALQHAAPSDVILIAGKGHENYQQIGEQRLAFSDSKVVKELLG